MATVGLSGGEKLKAKLDELSRNLKQGATVRVGFLENATYPDGTSVPMVAAIQNFGAPAAGIPPRPFFTNMVTKESPYWGDDVAETLKAADYDAEKTMAFMGEMIAGELRQSIVDTNDPPLSPVTLMVREIIGPNGKATFADVQEARARIARGETPSGVATKPLVWSGNLLNSVDYEVVVK